MRFRELRFRNSIYQILQMSTQLQQQKKPHETTTPYTITKRRTKQKSGFSSSNVKPFASLWQANQSMKEYSAVMDVHATCYFGTGSARASIKRLQQTLQSQHIKGKQEVLEELHTHRTNLKRIMKKYSGVENVKVEPYCFDLRERSKQNLQAFKNLLSVCRKEKEKEHREYLRECWVNKTPDQPQVKLVKTLSPLEKMDKITRLGNTNECILSIPHKHI